MTARVIIVPGAQPSRDANGRALPAKLRFYSPGTTTPASVFTSNTLTVAHPFPILSDAAGRWPTIWADDANSFDVAWSDQVFDARIATYTGISPAADAVLSSTTLADASAAAAATSATAAADSATAAAASATTAQGYASSFSDLTTAVGEAQSSATASASSATDAAASAVLASSYVPANQVLNTRTISGGGLVTGGGDLSANRTLTVTGAAASDVRGGSDTSKALTAAALMASSAFQTLTDATTIAWNVANGYNATVTLGASGHTIGSPTGLFDGLCISLEIVQDATGSRTVSWNAIWDFGAAGLPPLQTTAGKADRIFGQYNARTAKIEASFRKGA